MAIIEALPNVDAPQIFGMDENVVFAFKEREGTELLGYMKSLQTQEKLVCTR